MLTGQGLIGKLVELLATKLLSREIDLALDDRKRACRSLVELYFCIDGLEDVTARFIEELQGVEDQTSGWRAINGMALYGRTLDSLSQRFLNAGAELYQTLTIIDPPLADALGPLYGFKHSFLLFMSDSIQVKDKDGERNRVLCYREPTERILGIDASSYYEWVKDHPLRTLSHDVHLEWPNNMLVGFEFREDFPSVEIEVSDPQAIAQFRSILEKHGEALGVAREKLRELLSKNFKVEEILYVSKYIHANGL